MSSKHYHRYLRAVPLFADVDDHDLDVIGAAVTELSFGEGEVLMRAGSNAREMVIVLDGALSVMLGDMEIATIESGGFAGEMGPAHPSSPERNGCGQVADSCAAHR